MITSFRTAPSSEAQTVEDSSWEDDGEEDRRNRERERERDKNEIGKKDLGFWLKSICIYVVANIYKHRHK